MLGIHDVHHAVTRPKPEMCWKSIISFHQPKGEELHPRLGNCSIGIATWRRRHVNARRCAGQAHHTFEEPRKGILSRTILQQQRGERSLRLL
jgi:hypothetical protein